MGAWVALGFACLPLLRCRFMSLGAMKMNTRHGAVFLASWVAVCSVHAQQAVFDAASGVLTLPAVKVGTSTYQDVRLLITNPSNYTFKLQAATEQVPAGPSTNVFNTSTGVLTLPSVKVGAQTYVDVTLGLTDAATYTFVLRSATKKEDDPPPKAGTAEVCLDQSMLAAGTRQSLTLRVVSAGSVINTSQSDSEVTGQRTFESQQATEIKSRTKVTSGLGASTEASTRTYVSLSGQDFLVLGGEADVMYSGFAATAKTVYSPPALTARYSLAAGQSVSSTLRAKTITTSSSIPLTIPPVETTEQVELTYLGVEDVSVPAGTFRSVCKWVRKSTLDGKSITVTQWVHPKGFALKASEGSSVTELVSGTINGQPITP